MAPQWMPQNIQKRLLLYVLQQLSLFSEIDLPNLDVSLGSSSQVTLTDVDLDTDAFQIPGLYLRSGKVKNIKLQLNMSGGVSIEGDGLDITVAVGSSPSKSHHHTTERSKFSFSQSTVDLANSIMLDGDLQDSQFDSKTSLQSIYEPIPTTEDSPPEETSTLNNMMKRAVEAALARLQLDIQGVTIRLILDHATLDLEVKKLDFSTNDGIRNIKVSGVSVLGVHPSADPGETRSSVDGENDLQSEVANDSSNDAYEDGVTDDEDDDDDDEMNEMMSSSILEKPKDLNDSLIYSKEEASSIYMSAASQVFESKRQELRQITHLLFISEIQVTFKGLLKIEDLDILVDEIKIAATPLPLTLLHIIESFVGLNSYSTYSRLPNLEAKMRTKGAVKNTTTTSSTTPSPPFKSLIIRKILLNLVSALQLDGSFSKPDEITLGCEHIELKYATSDLCHGSLNKLYFIQNDSIVGGFEENSDQNDVRFELRSNDFTLLTPKNLELNVDYSTLQYIINLTSYIPQINESLSRLRAKQPIRKTKASVTTLQTSVISLNIKLSDDTTLKTRISPISFSSETGVLSVSKLAVSRSTPNSLVTLLTLCHVEFITHVSDKQVRSYDNNSREVVLMSPATLSIEQILLGDSLSDLKFLCAEFASFMGLLEFPEPQTVFKTKKRTRVSTNVMFQSRQLLKLQIQLKMTDVRVAQLSEKFGDIVGKLEDISILLHKDGYYQLHVHKIGIRREFSDKHWEDLLAVINPDDKAAPTLSVRTKNFQTFNILLRNAIFDYYTNWLTLFDSDSKQSSTENSSNVSDSETFNAESTIEVKLNLVDSAIGLNPGRLQSKANLVIPNGSIDVLVAPTLVIKSELRGAVVVLIDDVSNIVGHDESKSNKTMRPSWSQAAYFNSRGFASVGKLKSLLLNMLIKPPLSADSSNSIIMDISSDLLELELCADSSQCFLQLLNDLKQPVIINPDDKYKVQGGRDIDVFEGIDDNTFSGTNINNKPSSNNFKHKDEPFNFVESYYDEQQQDDGSDLLNKDLSELAIKPDGLKNNPFFAGDQDQKTVQGDSQSENTDSLLVFNDKHFQDSVSGSVQISETSLPMVMMLNITKIVVKIYDGYDWKFTRKTISTAVKRLEKKAIEQRALAKVQFARASEQTSDRSSERTMAPHTVTSPTLEDVVGETLFDSIHVSLPLSTDPSRFTEIINKDIQTSVEDTNNGIDVGKKSNIKKLKLRRSNSHKVTIELNELICNFSVLSNKDPVCVSDVLNDSEFEVLNELDLEINNFEVTDNVSTSTWNKFVTYMKDSERESGSKMLKLNMKTVRPVSSLAATEFLMSVRVVPLRLHVDQDTLEVLTRFGEFKDARFALIDEFEDIAYIQRFDINAVHIKLDYKPKKVDYSGLKSGHTTEFMNFFILDEADMILKQATLYGVSGFPKLGVALNDLWMPDIKANQLSGILTGLAPVRSIAKIGTGVKDLIVVPVAEYRKDGRLYRSLSKGLQQFTKTTTNEMLKFGVKLAAGTQTLLENTEEALGGTGSAARLTQVREISEDRAVDSEEDDDDSLYDDMRGFGHSSHLIGKGSSAPLQRSVYQPTLESIVDINGAAGLQFQRGGGRSSQGRRPSFGKFRNYADDDDAFEIEDEDFFSGDGPRTVSLYADQPTSLKEGFLLAYDSFGRNLLVAKDAIINAGTEISESGSAHDTTMAVLKATPVILLRPIIGATEAASRALLGINNQLDPTQRDYTEDKYKKAKK